METLKQKVVEHLITNDGIDTGMFGNNENKRRAVRKVLSDLSNSGIIYVPVSKGYYLHESLAEPEDVEKYFYSQLKHIKTQYQNKVKPLRKLVIDNKLTRLMGTLDEAFKEIT